MIGCLIISLTDSLLLEIRIRAILIIQHKLVYLINSAFYRLINMTPTITEQYVHKDDTNYTIQKYMHRKITQCKLHTGMQPYHICS